MVDVTLGASKVPATCRAKVVPRPNTEVGIRRLHQLEAPTAELSGQASLDAPGDAFQSRTPVATDIGRYQQVVRATDQSLARHRADVA